MGFSLKDIAIAGAVAGATLQGASAFAQETNTPLTEEQQIAVNLVKEYNTCVATEDTPERDEALRLYAQDIQKIEEEYDADYEAWRQANTAYRLEFIRIMEKYDIDRSLGVPSNYPELATEIEFANIDAIDQKIDELVRQEIGLTLPDYPRSKQNRIDDLGDAPQSAVELCSDQLTPKFEAAGIDIGWDLRVILQGVIKEQGPEAYEALVAPEGP